MMRAESPSSASETGSPLLPPPPLVTLPKEFFIYPRNNVGFVPPPFLLNPEHVARIRPPKTVKTLKDRLAEFSPEQLQILEECRKIVQEQHWYDPQVNNNWMLLRYLVARNFNLEKTLHMLEKTMKWRAEVKPDTITCAKCLINPDLHMLQFVGWDMKHRPVLYSSFRWGIERNNPEEGLIHSITAFNHALSLMPEGVEQWVGITDFVTYSHWKDSNPKQGGDVISTMQDHFPERLGIQILIDPPTTFWVLWKLLSVFIDAKTKEKVRFWYTDQKPNIADEFPKIFPPHLSDYLVETFKSNKTFPKKD